MHSCLRSVAGTSGGGAVDTLAVHMGMYMCQCPAGCPRSGAAVAASDGLLATTVARGGARGRARESRPPTRHSLL